MNLTYIKYLLSSTKKGAKGAPVIKKVEELYSEAIKAFKKYNGSEEEPGHEDVY